MFENFGLGRYLFRLKALSDLHLPAYKGSTLRGGFGQALRQVTCALKRQDCRQCLLRERCVYLYLFETPPPADAEMMRLYPSAPHPFVIEPPLSDVRIVPEGELLEFGLLLVGRALDYLPYFVYAFICLGERGLGRGQGKFMLDEVLVETDRGPLAIYDVGGQSLHQATPAPASDLVQRRVAELDEVGSLNMNFLTPTRIKFDGHLVEKPEFHHLMRSLLRRLSSLSYFHCGQRLDLDFRGLVERAGQVQRVGAKLTWYDWERYSSRQKQLMSLGGFQGSASYSGDLAEFLPVIAWGELLHIGKAASFGLGKYELLTSE